MTIRTISAGHTFLESPRWHQGDLYVSDFFAQTVLRFPGGSAPAEVVATVPGIPSGLGFLPEGDLLVVSMNDRAIFRVIDGELELYSDLSDHVHGLTNDMHVDAEGRCYVGSTGHSPGDESDFGPAPLLIVQPDREVVAAGLELNFPNGIVQSDPRTLLVAETYAGTVREVKLDEDGLPTQSRIWAEWNRVDYFDIDRAHQEVAVEPDGLALGRDGTLWVADAKGGGIARVDRQGEVAEFVEVGDLSVFAALAVEDKLYMCCSPRNRTVDWSALRSSELRVADIS